MNLLSKTQQLVSAIYNDFNQLFDQDEIVPAEIPVFQMDRGTALKVQMMENSLNGYDASCPMRGSIYVINNGKPESMLVQTVGEARAIIARIKSGDLRL